MGYNPNDIQSGANQADLVNELRNSFGALLPLFHPGYVSGRRYGLPLNSVATAGTLTTNTLYFFPIPVLSALAISSLAIRSSTAAATVTGRLGLYANANGVPTSLIAECNNDVDLNTTGAELLGTFAASPLSLTPDLYWGALACSGAGIPACVTATVINAGGVSHLLGGTNISQIVTATAVARIQRTATVTYTGAGVPFFPATAGALTYGAAAPGAPYIGFVVA